MALLDSSISCIKKNIYIYISSIKTKVAVKFLKKKFCFAENLLGAERVNILYLFLQIFIYFFFFLF